MIVYWRREKAGSKRLRVLYVTFGTQKRFTRDMKAFEVLETPKVLLKGLQRASKILI